MPDVLDFVQQQTEREDARALAAHVERPRQQGRTTCERHDCGEPIHPARTALGARLCIECQHEQEARDAHFNTWRRR